MTAGEIRSIERSCTRLVARYLDLIDAARWDAAAMLFVPDGRLARPSAPDVWIVGRPAILAAFLARPAQPSLHRAVDIVVAVQAIDAAVADYALVRFDAGKPPAVGASSDRLVLTGEGWRFAERRGVLLS